MTLDEFIATGEVADLSAIEYAASQELSGPGRVYAEGLYIEGDLTSGYTLTIGNSQISGALVDLERQLYAFGVAEGYIHE